MAASSVAATGPGGRVAGPLGRRGASSRLARLASKGTETAARHRSPRDCLACIGPGPARPYRPVSLAQAEYPDRRRLEVPLAHAVVDHLLGYDRPFAESRLQLTPVEWGVWTYLVVRFLEDFQRDSQGSPEHATINHPADRSWLVLDRVGPDPFNPAGLGAVVTLLSSIRVGSTTGTARFWLPESALNSLIMSEPRTSMILPDLATSKVREYSSLWRAQAGLVTMPDGLKRLRVGGVLPLPDSRLTGTPLSPIGSIMLSCGPTTLGETFQFPAEPVEGSSGRLLRLTGSLIHQQQPREPLPLGIQPIMSSNNPSAANGGTAARPRRLTSRSLWPSNSGGST